MAGLWLLIIGGVELFMNLFALKKKKYERLGSLSSIAWRRFRRDRLSFGALLFILAITVFAILGYLITPDSSPYANSQMLEIAASPPGYNIQLLKIKRNETAKEVSVIHKMLFGQESAYKMISVYSYKINGVYLEIEEMTGDSPNNGVHYSYNLPDIIYSLSDTAVKVNGNLVKYKNADGIWQTESIESLKEKVLNGNLVKKTFLLGTDRFGRDMLSRLLIGSRVSLSVGFISVFISLVLGIFIGAMAGFFRGWVDNLIVWFINVVWSIPTLLLVIAITFALGKGFWQVFIAVGLTMWVEVARVVRGQILSIREKEYVEAGRALGYKNFRIVFRHVLPNVMSAVIVISAANFASAILIEAGLSFLGIGVQPPVPSWGTMIREHYAFIILDSPYLAIIPGVAILLMVLSFMLVGNGLRDALDERYVEGKI